MYKKFDINYYQKGGKYKTISQKWEEYTGLPWSEARRMGLSDGSFRSNRELEILIDRKQLSLPSKEVKKEEQIPIEERELEELKIVAPKNRDIRYFQSGIKELNQNRDSPYQIYDKKSNTYYQFDEHDNLVRKTSTPNSKTKTIFTRDFKGGLQDVVYVDKDYKFNEEETKRIQHYFGLPANGKMTPELLEKVDNWRRKRKIDDWSTHFKKYLPFKPVSQMGLHFLGKGKMTENSFTIDENQALYDAIQNARKRNGGGNSGSTEYIDFDSNDYDSSLTKLVNTGQGKFKNILDLGKKLFTNDPTTNMKMSVGRGNYYVDENSDVYYTDIYDFNKSKKVNFTDNNPYARLRKWAGNKEKVSQNKSGEWDNSRIIIKLPHSIYGEEAKRQRLEREKYNDRFLYTP